MPNTLSCFEPLAAQDVWDPLRGYTAEGGLNKEKQQHFFEAENWVSIGDLKHSLQRGKEGFRFDIDRKQQDSSMGMQEDEFDSVFSELPNFAEAKKKPCSFTSSSLELLKTYNNGVKRMNRELVNTPRSDTSYAGNAKTLSTEEVMRVAGARFIRFFVGTGNEFSMLRHPFGYALSGLSYEESQDVELAHLLLGAAEKVGNQQFDRAGRLLDQCEYLSSRTGNPVQRVVYYFAEALRARIDRETGGNSWKSDGGKGRQLVDVEEAMRTPHPAVLECHRFVPFSQVVQFAGIQSIVENVASAKKVHLIDLAIKSGAPWTVLMQAFVARHGCRLEHLKITAIGTSSREKIEDTGKRLASFAKNLNLPFTFKVVIVSDMKDLNRDLFELKEDEAIVVNSHLALRTMLNRTDHLDALMRVIKNLNPCIMVLTEVEANHNSPVLMNRFIETLFYYSSYFDCLEVCMNRNNENRLTLEGLYLGSGIHNSVAAEGEERTQRNVGICVWRAFFRRFKLVETELSPSSLYQASLILKQYTCSSSCTLGMNGKSLIIGWKGTPIHSVSAWKFV